VDRSCLPHRHDAGVSLPVFFTGLLLVYVFYYPARLGAGAARAARRVL
jgi:ABC-type dipeptide/oligopeptide/nickel transport system permease component